MDHFIRRFMLTSVLFSASLHAQILLPTEDLRELAANRSAFAPASAVEAGVQTHSGFTREVVQVQWRTGDPIDVYIVRPENVVRPPAVLFLYTWPGDDEHFKNDGWCRSVTEHGFAAVGFVSAFTGQRYHDRPWKETFVTELPETLAETVHDVQLMLDYLTTRGDFDTSRYGIFGQGSGGTIAVLAASVDPRLKAVDVIDPWGDWPDFFPSSPVLLENERAPLLTRKSLDALAPFDTSSAIKTLSGRALRLQQTAMNRAMPDTAAARLRASLTSQADYVKYNTEEDYRERAMKDARILNWLQEHLQ